MKTRRRALRLLLAPAATVLCPSSQLFAAPATPIVAAASDLNPVLDEIAQRFETETGRRLRLVFGSSGHLQSQIRQGAPFELFLCADEALVLALRNSGRTPDEGVVYGIGRLVLFAGVNSPIKTDGELKDLQAAARDGRLRRLALANPEHAPYGRAAKEVLVRLGLWDALQGRLVFGENVVQAAQFAAMGAAEAALVALSLTHAPRLREAGRHADVPQAWHTPLTQRMVRIQPYGETAAAFYAYLQTPAARAMLTAYGFRMPD
ncbi:Molybdate-binding protein ModA [Burkholderiales bacterium]|nr:MAG: molybdate ABC transporter substrate-binding protein [Burkholderiales bacterium]CAG0961074.1 Molybdate-binding protein ModA [Burkholderiales bacterium]